MDALDAMQTERTEAAYRHCIAMVRGHYENFPVASWILPRRLRRPIAVIYAFARTADDLADEGDLAPQERLAALEQMDRMLVATFRGADCDDPIFVALADVQRRHELPLAPFRDLLTAFRMDVEKKRYANFGELMAYCRYSANPVGRLLLHLFGSATERNVAYSDAVCSALQLINFLQDIGQDYDENNRIYLPEDEMQRFGVSEDALHEHRSDESLRRLIGYQADRARKLLLSGAPLGNALKGRTGLEIRMIVAGGIRVLNKLSDRHDVFVRPRLDVSDWGWVLWRALRAR